MRGHLYLAIAFHELTVIIRVWILQEIEVRIELSDEAAVGLLALWSLDVRSKNTYLGTGVPLNIHL
jgi:hypothetical protein